MAQTWSPEDEEGFGIRGADTDALTAEQQKALDDLRVQTARDNQEYLHDHPEVKAMLSLLIRETLLQGRDVRSVAGELFRSEKQVVAAVRRMLGMRPTAADLRRRAEDSSSSQLLAREVTFSDASGRKAATTDEAPTKPCTAERPCVKRRDTPAPWIEHQLLLLSDTAGEIAAQEAEERQNLAWMQRELEDLAARVDRESSQRARRQVPPWLASIGGDGDEEVIPLARRDTPAPWLAMSDDLATQKTDKEKYVLGLLEKILEDPGHEEEGKDVFTRLQKIVEEGE